MLLNFVFRPDSSHCGHCFRLICHDSAHRYCGSSHPKEKVIYNKMSKMNFKIVMTLPSSCKFANFNFYFILRATLTITKSPFRM